MLQIKKESKKLCKVSDLMQTLSILWFALCPVTKHNDLLAVFYSYDSSLFVVSVTLITIAGSI